MFKKTNNVVFIIYGINIEVEYEKFFNNIETLVLQYF